MAAHSTSISRPSSLKCSYNVSRSFTSTPIAHKKAGKANKAHARTDSSPPVSKAGHSTATDEAFDLSGLESEILKAIEQLTHKLSQLRGGGRLNPEVVEGLKVQLGVAGKDGTGKETVRLADIAQVVPRGRTLHVICGDAEVCHTLLLDRRWSWEIMEAQLTLP